MAVKFFRNITPVLKFLILTMILLVFFKSVQTQNLVKYYKAIADKSFLKYMDAKMASKVTCDGFTTLNADKRSSTTYLYNENRNEHLSFSTITFGYHLFNIQLKVDFWFYIEIGHNKKLISDSSIVIRVPECIRRSETCNFISSDSAKSISIKDSIQYQNNLNCELERNEKDSEFYWIIIGRPTDRHMEKKPTVHVHVVTTTNLQERIINAKSGHLISMSEFTPDWRL